MLLFYVSVHFQNLFYYPSEHLRHFEHNNFHKKTSLKFTAFWFEYYNNKCYYKHRLHNYQKPRRQCQSKQYSKAESCYNTSNNHTRKNQRHPSYTTLYEVGAFCVTPEYRLRTKALIQFLFLLCCCKIHCLYQDCCSLQGHDR